jgi:predicted permease
MIMSYDLWQQRFGGDPSVIGRRVTLNGAPRTVIGVMPERFSFPLKETRVWLPTCSLRACASLTTNQPDTLDGFANHYLNLVARLRDGFTRDQAFSEANALARQIMREHPGQFSIAAPLVPEIHQLRDQLVGSARPFLIALLSAVGVVLLIVCANVASLLLSRGEARRREMSLRMALGAPRRRLVTQLLTEAVTLSIIGGVAGLALAWAGSRGLVALAPPSLPRLDEIRVDWLVVVFGVLVSLAAGIVFGIAPAMRASREDPAEAITSSGKGASAGRRSARARHAFVVAEVALSMVLLSGAGMLVRSLIHMQRQDMGFDTAGALTAKISLNNGPSYSDGRVIQFYQDMQTRLRAMRGTQAVGAARWLPVTDQGGSWDIIVDGKTFPPGQTPTPTPQEVTPGWFAAMGTRIKQGRDFTDADRAGSPLVAIVSEGLARKIWGDEGALNRRFRLGGKNSDSLWVTVIGVVGDIRARNFTDQPEPTMYFAYPQAASSSYYVSRTMSFVVRAQPGVDPMTFANQVRSAAGSLDPSAAVSNVMSLDAVVGTVTANRRFSTMLIAGFAALALVLATIGIYGVISYAVSERRFELGVRMALGADRGDVMSLVVGEGVRLAAIGVAIGIIGAIALSRIMSTMLVGARGVDVMTLSAMSAVLGFAGALASLLPARRATAASPTEALRSGG